MHTSLPCKIRFAGPQALCPNSQVFTQLVSTEEQPALDVVLLWQSCGISACFVWKQQWRHLLRSMWMPLASAKSELKGKAFLKGFDKSLIYKSAPLVAFYYCWADWLKLAGDQRCYTDGSCFSVSACPILNRLWWHLVRWFCVTTHLARHQIIPHEKTYTIKICWWSESVHCVLEVIGVKSSAVAKP